MGLKTHTVVMTELLKCYILLSSGLAPIKDSPVTVGALYRSIYTSLCDETEARLRLLLNLCLGSKPLFPALQTLPRAGYHKPAPLSVTHRSLAFLLNIS